MGHCCFLFLQDVLQAQKLVELEGIVGAEIKAEEEPRGETIVGPGREALRPPGMNIILFQINLPTFWVDLNNSSLGSLLY